jgi:protocatechuate 3,4-dioxygenase beta subunit
MKPARLAVGLLALFCLLSGLAWFTLAEPWTPPVVGIPDESTLAVSEQGDPPETGTAQPAPDASSPNAKSAVPERAPDQPETDAVESDVAGGEERVGDTPGLVNKQTAELVRLNNFQRWVAETYKDKTGASKVIYKGLDNSLGGDQPHAVKFKTITGTVTGQVLDPWGAPIQGASVSTVRTAGTLASAQLVFVNSAYTLQTGARTNETGMFTLTVNELALEGSDVVSIRAAAHGYSASEPLKITLNPNQASSGHVLRLRAAASLEGYVVDSRGVPVSGVTIMLAGQGAAPATKTDGAGRFRFEPLSAGIYVVIAKGPGVKQSGKPEGITVEPGVAARLPAPVKVDLVPCIVGTLQGDPSERSRIRSAVLHYTDEKGARKKKTVKVATDGTFSLELGAGRYDVEIEVKGHISATVVVYITDGPYDVGTITMVREP